MGDGTTACLEEVRNKYKILIGKREGREHTQDVSVGGSLILKWVMGNRI
jgi:hypothetical protein